MDTIIETIEKGLEAQSLKLEKSLVDMQAKMDEQIKLNGKANEETKEAHKNLEAVILNLKERQDAIEKNNNRIKEDGLSFKDSVEEALKANKEELTALKSHGRPFEMTTKATITETGSYTGEVVPADYVTGFKYDPERRIHIRQFIPNGNTNSDKIRYVRETAFTDNTGITAEAAASGQNDFTLQAYDANVEKIAAHFRVSREALDDTAGLASHISLRGTEKYMKVEDEYLLYDSTYGLTITSTDYTLDQYTNDANAQEFDVLLQAIKQIKNRNYVPGAIFVSINRYFSMIQRKDADGRYIFPQSVVFGSERPRVLGVPIIATNALNSDDFLVADMPQLTTLFNRKGMSVRFYEQDQDNVIKDLVTVQISGRLALPTYLPDAGCFGSFATAIQNAGNS